MTIRTDNQIKLSNGRFLGFAEYGDPNGKPLLYFHGCPSSRLEGNLPAVDEAATRLNIHIITPDRPGIGLSNFKPYTIISWPDIVTEFADKFGISRFAVLGSSSGGKYAAACAWKIPERLTVAGIISGNCPYDLPGAKETLSKEDKQMYTLADKTPWLLRLMLWKNARDVRKNPSIILSLFNECELDKATVAQPDVKQMFEKMVVEAFRQGVRGVAHDLMLEARPWGFSLPEIDIPVHVWHGEADKIVPVEQGRIQALAIPNARARFFPNEGHTLGVNQLEAFLDIVVDC